MNWETYIAFGDSITIGARTYLGYPELVANKLSIQLSKGWNVINHSVSGFKAIDLSRYIDQHFLNLKEHKAGVSTILIGTNDIREKTSVENFRIALRQILVKVRLLTINNNVILFHIPAFHPGIMYPYSIDMNTTINEFNRVIDQLAKEEGIRVLELINHPEDFFDGVHLNEKGIETFSEQIATYILKDKGLSIG
jgi:lysophospholipase L1-like esterase